LDAEVCLEIWNALRPHLISGDLKEAADDFVHVMIENGFNAEDLAEYAVAPEIKSALKDYAELEEYEDEDDEIDELDFS
jgi:hypothetical protein